MHQQEIERWTKEADSYLSATQGCFKAKVMETNKYIINGPFVEAILKGAKQEGVYLIA